MNLVNSPPSQYIIVSDSLELAKKFGDEGGPGIENMGVASFFAGDSGHQNSTGKLSTSMVS